MTAHVADDQIPSAVRRLARALGAEMFGVDLAERLDGPTARAVRTRLLEHVVIFLHDQQLAPPQRWRWPRASEVDAYPLVKGLPEGALALPIIGGRTTGVNFGAIWHSDTAYLERVAHATGMATRAAAVKAADACGRRGSAP